jgi:predicted MFS family arabinose efflux permease
MLSALAPFKVRSYRFQWPADLLTSWALEMEFIILGWYVLVETGSVVMLTVFGALQQGGTLIAPMMGVASDRIGPRNLLTGMRIIYAMLATTLMLLAFTGALNPVIVLVLVALMGLVRPSDLGLRAALIADTMPQDTLTGAMGFNRITSDSARIAGALTGAGLVALIGLGPTYVVIASFYALAAFLTSRADSAHSKAATVPVVATVTGRVSAWTDLRDGIVYIWNTPSLLAIISFVLLFNLFAFPLTNALLPYVAREIYGVDQAGLSFLITAVALGAMLGGLAMGRVGISRLSRLMIATAILWHLLLIVFAQMQTFTGGLAALFVTGIAQSLAMVSLTVILVRESGQRFRGRVMGVRMLAIYTLPIGLLISGPLIERIGFTATATLYALIGLLVSILITLRWRTALLRIDQPFNAK